MFKKLMVAVAMVALFAAPSFAAVQNVKVSGDLSTTSVIRSDIGGTSNSQNEILSQTNLKIAADLTDNVSTMIGLKNERLWGNNEAGASGSVVRLDSAYVTMKEMLYAPLTVTVGRQPLVYGNQLIIGDGDLTSDVTQLDDLTGGANFDAIKAVLAYEPLTVDIFAARTNNNGTTTSSTTSTQDNVNLYGVNANYKMGDKMSTVVEAYAFVKQDDTTTLTRDKSTTTYTPGLRLSTNPIEGLNVQLEGAYQLGHFWDGTDMQTRAGAYALQGSFKYALPGMNDMRPVLMGGYTYLSGNGTDQNKKGWDTMAMNQNVGKIYHALTFDGANSQLGMVGLSLAPMKDVTTALSATGVWLANGSSNNSRYLGTEADLDVTYAYTEDVKFGVSAGYFMTGKAYLPGGNNNNSQLVSSVSVAF